MRGRAPIAMACPDCGAPLRRERKGMTCPNPGCGLIGVRFAPAARYVTKIVRASAPRPCPLSDEEVVSLVFGVAREANPQDG